MNTMTPQVDASRSLLLWRNSPIKLADAIEKVCLGKDMPHKLAVMHLCYAFAEARNYSNF